MANRKNPMDVVGEQVYAPVFFNKLAEYTGLHFDTQEERERVIDLAYQIKAARLQNAQQVGQSREQLMKQAKANLLGIAEKQIYGASTDEYALLANCANQPGIAEALDSLGN